MTRGRRREHYQWNMDVWGVPGVEAEAELIAAVFALLDRLALARGDVKVRVSSRRLLEAMARAAPARRPELFAALCVAVDKLGKIGARRGGRAAHRPGGPGRPRRGGGRGAARLPRGPRTSRRRAAGSPPRPAPRSRSSRAALRAARRLRRRRPRRLRRLDRARARLLHGGRLRGLRRRPAAARDLRAAAATTGCSSARRRGRVPAVGFGFGDAVIGELLEEQGPPAGAGPRPRRRGVAFAARRDRRGAARRHPLRDARCAREGAPVELVLGRRPSSARSGRRPGGCGARAPDRAGRARARRRPGARPRDRRESATSRSASDEDHATRTGAAPKRYRYPRRAELRRPAARRNESPHPPLASEGLAMRAWTVRDSLELYNVPNWGARLLRHQRQGARRGARRAAPTGRPSTCSSLVHDLQGRGVRTPMLVRFSDILAARVRGLARGFRSCDRRVRLQRPLPRRLPDQGQPAAPGRRGDGALRRRGRHRPRGRAASPSC